MQVIESKRNQGASSEVVRDINRRIVLRLYAAADPAARRPGAGFRLVAQHYFAIVNN